MHTQYQVSGGEDSAVATMQDVLASAGHDVHTVLFNNINNSAIKFAGSMYNPASAHRVTREAKLFTPDVVHIHNTWFGGSPSVVRALRNGPAAIVGTLHNFRPLCINGAFFREGKPCLECLEQPYIPGLRHACFRSHTASIPATLTQVATKRGVRLSRWFDHAFVLSEFSLNMYVQAGWPPYKISVAKNTVAGTSRGLATPGTSQKLLFVGRDSPEKGLETLLNAWPIFHQRNPSVELRLAGIERCNLAGTTALGRLTPDEVRGEMLSARALLVPSVCFENQPMVIVEAMCAGLPSVVSNHGSLPEMVGGAGGEAGIVASPDNPVDWAARMESLWSIDVDAIGSSARSRYEMNHRPDVVAARTVDVYERAREERLATRLS